MAEEFNNAMRDLRVQLARKIDQELNKGEQKEVLEFVKNSVFKKYFSASVTIVGKIVYDISGMVLTGSVPSFEEDYSEVELNLIKHADLKKTERELASLNEELPSLDTVKIQGYFYFSWISGLRNVLGQDEMDELGRIFARRSWQKLTKAMEEAGG